MFSQEFIQQIALQLILSAIAGTVAFAQFLFREFIFGKRSERENSELIELLDKVSYRSKSKSDYMNALVFKKATGRYAPVHVVNQVFDCYDPCFAARIYSRDPIYLKLDNIGRNGPNTEIRRISKVTFSVLFAIGFFLLGLNTWVVLSISTNVGGTELQQNQSTIYALIVFFFLFYGISISTLYWTSRELSFLKDVDRFYKGYWRTYRLYDTEHELSFSTRIARVFSHKE
ncbi:MAG: hypothetical protein AAF716_19070 [Cyanobacteria bacterium P01_D01_bin.1]